MTYTIEDFLEANEIVASLEQRRRTLLSHVEHGVQDDALDIALVRNIAAEDRIRKAFRISEPELDAAFEAWAHEMTELVDADVPLALHIYQAEGR